MLYFSGDINNRVRQDLLDHPQWAGEQTRLAEEVKAATPSVWPMVRRIPDVEINFHYDRFTLEEVGDSFLTTRKTNSSPSAGFEEIDARDVDIANGDTVSFALKKTNSRVDTPEGFLEKRRWKRRAKPQMGEHINVWARVVVFESIYAKADTIEVFRRPYETIQDFVKRVALYTERFREMHTR